MPLANLQPRESSFSIAGLLSWTMIPNYVMSGHDIGNGVAGLTREACLQLCEDSSDPECYSIDYYKSTAICFRNKASSAGAPIGPSGLFDFYIHCKKRITNGDYIPWHSAQKQPSPCNDFYREVCYEQPPQGPFYWHGLTLTPTWISNRMHSKIWNAITYLFPNVNGCTVHVWEWIGIFIPYFVLDAITCPCWG